ncbi:sensor histidine kinase [Paenibacillus doosanensis]|uniref:Signal transduction histidine-protein kinase/phosphatase DegS n=1 Tax=Paenibacillus konkukensis TaxID=2020716 RepID=A0ABY4RQC5_9BACL|nr:MULTISPECIES: sensor histidine kinase [Paenibacillus]MCS7459962.1 sensor histidine kinase [Paenibacillus doosanensis]UQZ84405.1 Signal transduction histidine-protein kinase/phosphatase DegS [Paenibacillus konkukensis]
MQVDALDRIIKNAIDVMESSKYQIFEICENVRSERNALNNELQQVIDETTKTIDMVDHIEMEYRRARIRLTEVSRDFKRFKEDDIRTAYEFATQMQTQLAMYREKELHLKARRDDLQKRIKNVDKQLERAEAVVSQVNVVLEYLSGDLNQVTRLLESAKNRQLLGLKIILAQEEERKRIAREIHDGLAQTMANVVLRTEIAERMLTKQAYTSVKEELVDLKGQVRGGIEEVRKIIFNLRPMALDDLGVIPALRKFVQDFEEKSRIRTQFEFTGKDARLPSGMEVAIYRLVQEAFSNVVKHAQASHVMLEVTYQKQMVKIVVTDNGVGFTLDNIDKKIEKGSHYGIIGMRERVELLEGRIEMQSAKGAGTKISMLIPIKLDSKEE